MIIQQEEAKAREEALVKGYNDARNDEFDEEPSQTIVNTPYNLLSLFFFLCFW